MSDNSLSGNSVNEKLAGLHAHRVATMKPEELAYNINQRQWLVKHSDRSTFIKPGDVVEPFTLPEVDGGEVSLTSLLATGPAVLIIFRFAGCPACNLTLPTYRDHLLPGIAARSAGLVAISPQVPQRLREIKERHHLGFAVASDLGNALGRKFGIVFTASAESQAHVLSRGVNMPEIIGTGTWDLPMPAAIVIDARRVVRYAAISPDWLIRAEADEILAAVDQSR